MNNKQVELTKEGFEALEKELRELVDIKRPKLVDRLSFASSQGDLSENSDYTNAKEELEFLDGRISEIEDVIKNAVIVKSNGHKNKVDVGTKVTVKVNGSKFAYNIVGEWEADPMEKKISHTSPLGQSLVGKTIGDKVEVEAPAGKIQYEILAIE
ncbi:transcription elongation factor GreA [Candidatus Woesebacteria bacterium]|nr:transcription elongation factor GreA [Candidatus Woesebacteria bacterium]QQG47880.1 MAG: transcription elongation factor GreA [Candidatus Woesebacteria bacterium]